MEDYRNPKLIIPLRSTEPGVRRRNQNDYVKAD